MFKNVHVSYKDIDMKFKPKIKKFGQKCFTLFKNLKLTISGEIFIIINIIRKSKFMTSESPRNGLVFEI